MTAFLASPELARIERAIEEAERIVIEAAKVWVMLQDNDSAKLLTDAVRNLVRAEALEPE